MSGSASRIARLIQSTAIASCSASAKRAGARAQPVQQPAVPVADRQGLGDHDRLDPGVHEPAHRDRHAHQSAGHLELAGKCLNVEIGMFL
jgi:hypothetical protein